MKYPTIPDLIRQHGLSISAGPAEVIAMRDRRPTTEEKLAAAHEEYAALHARAARREVEHGRAVRVLCGVIAALVASHIGRILDWIAEASR